MRTKPILAVLTFAATLCAATGAWAQKQDKIFLRNGSIVPEETVEITEMTYKVITYNSETAAGKTISAREVVHIDFDPQNKTYDFVSAEKFFEGGDFAAALDKFERVLKDSKASDPLKQTARSLIIQCHFNARAFGKAIEAAKALLAEDPESFFLSDAYQACYAAARGLGQPAAVDEAVKAFEKAGQEKGVEEWKKKADLMRAEVQEAGGQHRQAKSTYDKYVGDRDPELALQGRLGLMRTMANLSDWAGLKARAEGFINDPGKNLAKEDLYKLLLGAHLARGKALLYGEKNNKAALEDLTRCAFHLWSKINEPSVEHAEALYCAAVACARYATSQTEPEKKAAYTDRAWQLRNELRDRYPSSPLLPKAEEELNAIK